MRAGEDAQLRAACAACGDEVVGDPLTAAVQNGRAQVDTV